MPRRLEMGSTSQQHKDGGGWCLIDQQIQHFQGCGVRPVEVFQHKEDRLTFGKVQEDRDNGVKGLLALPLRRDVERCVPRFW